jgi:predicted RNA binding protein YcfA (HicA-like mRNA interferase family)
LAKLNPCWQCPASSAILRRVPRKIRQLVSDLEHAGFFIVSGGKGSHRKFRHARFPGAVILSGKDGHDAKHYQEKHVREAIREVSK